MKIIDLKKLSNIPEVLSQYADPFHAMDARPCWMDDAAWSKISKEAVERYNREAADEARFYSGADRAGYTIDPERRYSDRQLTW